MEQKKMVIFAVALTLHVQDLMMSLRWHIEKM